MGITGLEPATSTMSTWHSNQLSYIPSQTVPLYYNIETCLCKEKILIFEKFFLDAISC